MRGHSRDYDNRDRRVMGVQMRGNSRDYDNRDRRVMRFRCAGTAAITITVTAAP